MTSALLAHTTRPYQKMMGQHQGNGRLFCYHVSGGEFDLDTGGAAAALKKRDRVRLTDDFGRAAANATVARSE